MEDDKYKNIEDRVAFNIEGKHGMIGVILPEKESTHKDWVEFNQSIAAIIYRSQKNKQMKKEAQ